MQQIHSCLVGVSAIPKSEAAKLAGHTLRFSDDPDNYVVILDVFHQLHCLVRTVCLAFLLGRYLISATSPELIKEIPLP